MAILDFLKSKDQDDPQASPVDQTTSNAAGQASPSTGLPSSSTTAQQAGTNRTMTQTHSTGSVQATTSTTMGTRQAYSGIGRPPGGAKPYSGIGAPPTPSPTQTTTTTKTTSTNPTSSAQTGGLSIPPPTPQQTSQPGPAQQPKVADKPFGEAQDKLTDKTGKPADSTGKSNTPVNKQAQLDLMTHLTQRSNRVFMTATNKAKEIKSEFVDSEHLLHGLLSDPEIYKIFTDEKIQPQLIEQELEKIYKKGNATKLPQPSPRVKRILERALVVARKLGYDFISPEHILLALFEEGEGAGARILAKLGLKKEALNKKVTGKKEGLEAKNKDRGGKPTGTLEQFSIDLTAKAAQGLLDPVVERSEVIERVIHILSRRTKNNPALIGEAGVGKTAIVEGLAQSITSKKVPDPLLNKRVLQLDLMSILAGASHRGEFEERMKKIIEEVVAAQGKIILFIDEIHNLVGAGAGGESSLDASNFLKPSLARGELQVIGATTITEYRRYIEKDPALERRFQPITVPEPTEEQAIKMLKALRDKYEAFHRVKIPNDAIEAAVKLSKRYVGDRFLPDKAVDLIDEAGSAVRLPLISLPEKIRSEEERIAQLKQERDEAQKAGNKVKVNILTPKLEDLEVLLKEKKDEFDQKKSQTTTDVTPQIIKDIIARWTNIPVSKITESEVEKLTKLEEIMHERLIDQDYAVGAVAEAVRRGRAGLKSTKRPIGGFVFMGPTGVGKTELAKTLASVLFGQEEAMVRFDMTEYMEKHEVAKLLGAPPGYVGYEEGGKLTEAVRRRPYSVVLFDEIEKAHADIFNILLQILDDGRLTDNKGHVISFKNTVVICTSNIGTKTIQDAMMASGKVEIEEPDVLSTYVFSPRGRQIMTIMGKVFEKAGESPWKNKMLIDYFAGQEIEYDKEKKQAKKEFPGKSFTTHAISPKGIEMITVDGTLYSRMSTTAKIWKAINLIEYFKDSIVINALPDAPEQQLPTARLKTHTFTPDEQEIVTIADRFWKRKTNSKDWQTGILKEYFKDHTIQDSDNSDNQSTSNAKQTQEKGSDNKPTAINTPKSSETQKSFPINYWDIHTFSPQGDEYIIVGNEIWIRTANTTVWQHKSLKDFFGADFPIEKELEEKQKIEDELSKNQYDRIKTKVMQELRGFMRPELINRFDEVIIFEPLKYHDMLKIVGLQLKGVKELMEDQSMGFSWTPKAAKEILRQGFDPLYGARPLRRTIQKLIENPISTLIIQRKAQEGNSVVVDFDGENFVFNIEAVEMVPESKLKEKSLRKFMCTQSRHKFETEVVDTATVICPINASEPVQEIAEEKQETLEPNKTPQSNQSPPKEKPQGQRELTDLKQKLNNAANGNGSQSQSNTKRMTESTPPQHTQAVA